MFNQQSTELCHVQLKSLKPLLYTSVHVSASMSIPQMLLIINQHGSMTPKPHQKQHSFKVFTLKLSCRFPRVFKHDCISKCCTPCKVHHVYSSRSSQFMPKHITLFKSMQFYRLHNQRAYCFENVLLLTAFPKQPGFSCGLNWCRVNERCNRIESDAVKNETASNGTPNGKTQ